MDLIVDFPDRTTYYPSLVTRFANQLLTKAATLELKAKVLEDTCDESDLEASSSSILDTSSNLLQDFPRRNNDNIDDDLIIADSSTSSSSSSINSSSTNSNKGVAFEHRTRVIFVENLTHEHKKNLWLTESELDSFMLDRKRNIKMIKLLRKYSDENENENDDNDTKDSSASSSDADAANPAIAAEKKEKHAELLRVRKQIQERWTTVGLENHLDATASPKELVSIRKAHRRAVLEEQSRQKKLQAELDYFDSIAKVSRWGSESSVERARDNASWHASESSSLLL